MAARVKEQCTWCHCDYTPSTVKDLMMACDEIHCPFYDTKTPMNMLLQQKMGLNPPDLSPSKGAFFSAIEIATQPVPPAYEQKIRYKQVWDRPAVSGFLQCTKRKEQNAS